MKTFIITGASKGLGAAIAKGCLQTSDHCILVSRTAHPEMQRLADRSGTKLTFVSLDLNETEKLPSLVNEILTEVDDTSDIYFINNAGVIEPIKPVGNLGIVNLETSMRVNFMAPIVLADEFVKQTKDWNRKKVLVNISSGANSSEYQSKSLYILFICCVLWRETFNFSPCSNNLINPLRSFLFLIMIFHECLHPLSE